MEEKEEQCEVHVERGSSLFSEGNLALFWDMVQEQKSIQDEGGGAGRQNVIVFQCDNRDAGTLSGSDRKLNESGMFFHNWNKKLGLSHGYFFFFDSSAMENMSVYWMKAFCLAMLEFLFPDFLIFYVDSDAVMLESIFTKLEEIKPPTIMAATDHVSAHNAGWYGVIPGPLRACTEEESALMGREEFMIRANLHCDMDNVDFREANVVRDACVDEARYDQYMQGMISAVWRGSGLDLLPVSDIRSFLKAWAVVLGSWGNSHWYRDYAAREAGTLTDKPGLEKSGTRWAEWSYEQGCFVFVHRLAEAQGLKSLVTLFSGNEGYMIGHRLENIQVTMRPTQKLQCPALLRRDSIETAEEWYAEMKKIPMIRWELLRSKFSEIPTCIHLYGNLKAKHELLVNFLLDWEKFFLMETDENLAYPDRYKSFYKSTVIPYTVSMYHFANMNKWCSIQHTDSVVIHFAKTSDTPDNIIVMCSPLGGNEKLLNFEEFPNSYLLQIGYHGRYGLTGTLPDAEGKQFFRARR